MSTILCQSLLLALVGSVVAMPVIVAAWKAMGRTDGEVSLRKVHLGDVPRAGGVGMMLAFAVTVLIGLAGVSDLSASHELFSVSPLTGVLIGATIVWLTGLCDDLVGLRARSKLILQLAAASIAVLYGVNWPALGRLLGPELAWLEPMATILFLVVVTNAVNFMDGLDGLAASLGAVSLGVIMVGFMIGPTDPGSVALGWTAAAALGSTLGFLMFNRAPARVFMGDSGAYLLGFLLAGLALALQPVRPRVAVLEFSVPFVLLAVPLFDLLLAVLRRKIRGQPISAADSDHIHHRLLAAGLSVPAAVHVVALAASLFAAMTLANLAGVGGWWTLLGTVLAIVGSCVLLGYHRLLGRLPAFRQDGEWSWRERRRQVMAAMARLEHVAATTDVDDALWWKSVGPAVADALARIGVARFEIWMSGLRVCEAGDDGTSAWGYLGMPLPGHEGCEVRIFLVVKLPGLAPEAVAVLEKAITVLARRRVGSRHAANQPIVELAAPQTAA